MDSKGDEEEEKEAVVAPPHAVVHPGTVVVEGLNTVVADGTVRASRGSVELTGATPLHSDCDTANFDASVKGSSGVFLRHLGRLRVGSGVEEGGKGEVDDGKEGEDAFVDRNEPRQRRQLGQQLPAGECEEGGRCNEEEKPSEYGWPVLRRTFTATHPDLSSSLESGNHRLILRARGGRSPVDSTPTASPSLAVGLSQPPIQSLWDCP